MNSERPGDVEGMAVAVAFVLTDLDAVGQVQIDGDASGSHAATRRILQRGRHSGVSLRRRVGGRGQVTSRRRGRAGPSGDLRRRPGRTMGEATEGARRAIRVVFPKPSVRAHHACDRSDWLLGTYSLYQLGSRASVCAASLRIPSPGGRRDSVPSVGAWRDSCRAVLIHEAVSVLGIIERGLADGGERRRFSAGKF